MSNIDTVHAVSLAQYRRTTDAVVLFLAAFRADEGSTTLPDGVRAMFSDIAAEWLSAGGVGPVPDDFVLEWLSAGDPDDMCLLVTFFCKTS